MAVKKLPKDIQTLITASIRISGFKTAVEELVYNALDAGSTSIAIRVSIEGNTIQVIDNGCGISQKDFHLLGQRHATSKCVDLATLKSVPSKYGYRGQFLSSLIQVSREVKITSRALDSEQTFCKGFESGKETKQSETTKRPSKGTTVEVKGFLYNLNICKNSIDALREMRDIKTFLEQLSLVHSNISISLRDDSNNDIVFKLHKNRDIYQTLSTLFKIEKTQVQELIVEKNQYKAVAYIGKMDSEICNKHFIYLNGKFTHNNNIYKRVNDRLVKTMNLKFQTRNKVKSKRVFDEEEPFPSDGSIPFYVVLITCPYYDYDISHTPKHSMLEFKNWEPVDKLLEKLVKFYTGDLKLKEVKNQNNNVPEPNKPKIHATRDQVRKIVEKMLGNTIRKPGVSQMHHGVKGKLIKRKRKKRNSASEKELSQQSKVEPHKKTKRDDIVKEKGNEENQAADKNDLSYPVFTTTSPTLEPQTSKARKVLQKCIKKKGKLKIKAISPKNTKKTVTEIEPLNKSKRALNAEDRVIERVGLMTLENKSVSESIITNKDIVVPPKKLTKAKSLGSNKIIATANDQRDKPVSTRDPILEKFEKPTNSVKTKCEALAKSVEDLLARRNKSNCEFIMNTVQHNNAIHNNHNVSVRQRDGEYVVPKELPSRPPSNSPCTFDNRNWNVVQKNIRTTTYDLLHTILTTQTVDNRRKDYQDHQPTNRCDFTKSLNQSRYFVQSSSLSKNVSHDNLEELEKISSFSDQIKTKLTYESHHYGQVHLKHSRNNDDALNVRTRTKNFMTTQSREYFEATTRKPNFRQNFKVGFRKQFSFQYNPYTKRQSLRNLIKQNEKCAWYHQMEKSDFTIEFSKSKEISIPNDYTDNNIEVANEQARSRSPDVDMSPDCEEYATYTIIEQSNTYQNNRNNFEFGETHTLTSRTSHQFQLINQSDATNFEEHIGSYKLYSDENEKCFKDVGQNCKTHTNNDEGAVCALGGSTNNKNKEIDITASNEEENMNRVDFCSQNEDNIIDQDVNHNNSIDTMENIDPLNVCVTVHSQNYLDDDPGIITQHRFNDSLFNDDINLDSILLDRNIYTITSPLENQHEINDKPFIPRETNYLGEESKEPMINKAIECKESQRFNFDFRSRLRFVPKGLSPIFQNCQTKTVCSYTFDKDQFEERIYNDFANHVQTNTEVFEPRIQNVKDIDKVNSRVNKDNASLVFDGESLKNTLVLGQVDSKFIAAKIQGKSQQGSLNVNESLVLFDQHAVHERIRLEKNLTDYLNDQQWKSVALDGITVKLSCDDLIYLHNYRDKFMQFGLQWTITDRDHVVFTAIPEALLGKNPRQVEIIVKALKNLIAEEISAIKSQKGCVALYPKAIMDLVFSEACRYAIKFGDILTKIQCKELLQSLSECKTPFQCAHGRPVMAVIIDIQKEKREYKINPTKILHFLKTLKKSYSRRDE